MLIHAGQKSISSAPNHSVGEHERAEVESEGTLERNTFDLITVDILQRRNTEYSVFETLSSNVFSLNVAFICSVNISLII